MTTRQADNERKRASNIIWTAADDYAIQPDIKFYDASGRADLYWNFIAGAVHKYYDYPELEKYFEYLREDNDFHFFRELVWIGLENCAYERGQADRLVLPYLRRDFARRVLNRVIEPSDYYLVDKIRRAHYLRVLGETPELCERSLCILNDLEFDGSLDTGGIIQQMTRVIDAYFNFSPGEKGKIILDTLVKKSKEVVHLGKNNLFNPGYFLKTHLESVVTDFYGDVTLSGEKVRQNSAITQWYSIIDHRQKKKRTEIEQIFGTSMYPADRIRQLENTLCVGNHVNCNLHFTRASAEDITGRSFSAVTRREEVTKQREKNKKHFEKNAARYNCAITRLTNKLMNTMLVNLQPTSYPSRSGNLMAGRLWKKLYLNENRVFERAIKDDLGNLTIDLLLDASGSQLNRQEIISAEAYIIAESLTRCQIPVRIFSFFNKSNFTVINLLRDYTEPRNNMNVFNYCAAGCNRDGLAFKTVLHLMKSSKSDHRILIILSDAKPNDAQGITKNRLNPATVEYADATGINDTAQEVHKGRQEGVSVLCVFNGQEEDVPAAQRIFGHDFVQIKTLEHFSDVVGNMLQNELVNF